MLCDNLNVHVEKLMSQYVCCLTGVRTKLATMHHMLVAITKPTRDVQSNTTKLASCYSRAGILKEISTECLGNIGVEVLPNIVLGPLG